MPAAEFREPSSGLSASGSFHAVEMLLGRLEDDKLDNLADGRFTAEGGHAAFAIEFIIAQSGNEGDQFGAIFAQGVQGFVLGAVRMGPGILVRKKFWAWEME